MAHTIFIGRTTELQRLEESLKLAEGGQLQVIFIAGEAGAGKSCLVEEFIRGKEEADPKLITAIGECNAQTGAGDPYLLCWLHVHPRRPSRRMVVVHPGSTT